MNTVQRNVVRRLRSSTALGSGNTSRALRGSSALASSQVTLAEHSCLAAKGHHSQSWLRTLASTTGNVSIRTRPMSSTTTRTADDDDAGQDESPTRKIVKKRKGQSFVPRKAPVNLTETARTFFRSLLESSSSSSSTSSSVVGVMLNYHQSSTGEPRMVFSFDFVTAEQLSPEDEGVSLEVLEDGSPKPPDESFQDGLPKLYIHHNAFMKVLGGTLDVNLDTLKPILFDREGNEMDPNA